MLGNPLRFGVKCGRQFKPWRIETVVARQWILSERQVLSLNLTSNLASNAPIHFVWLEPMWQIEASYLQ